MQKYHLTTAIIAFALIFTDYFCNRVESVENAIAHKFCRCFNGTNEHGLILMKCICGFNGLKEVPNDLPTPLHEL